MHPKLAAAVGAVVDAFLMPSTWLLLVALLVVAAVVTILALFFGWVGHSLAAQRQRSRTADAMA